jgi:hypothetical protein
MSKIQRQAEQTMFIQLLTDYKKNNVIRWHQFGRAHFRVFTSTKTIDFYLNSLRWHDIKKNLRGDVSSLQDFHLYI